MNLTYRTKRRLHRAGLIGAIVLLVVILVGFCWVIWLERYIVYTRHCFNTARSSSVTHA